MTLFRAIVPTSQAHALFRSAFWATATNMSSEVTILTDHSLCVQRDPESRQAVDIQLADWQHVTLSSPIPFATAQEAVANKSDHKAPQITLSCELFKPLVE